MEKWNSKYLILFLLFGKSMFPDPFFCVLDVKIQQRESRFMSWGEKQRRTCWCSWRSWRLSLLFSELPRSPVVRQTSSPRCTLFSSSIYVYISVLYVYLSSFVKIYWCLCGLLGYFGFYAHSDWFLLLFQYVFMNL